MKWIQSGMCSWFLFYIVCFSLLHLSLSTLTLAPSMQEVVRYVNESYIVTCTASNRQPVEWHRDKRLIGDHGHPYVSMMNTAMALVFERITATDRGIYTCKTADVSSNITNSFNLVVISPITFVDAPAVQTAKEHHSAIVKCQVRGDPKPKVLWKFDGRDVALNRYSVIPDGLKIKNVSLEDRGTYTCRAYQVSQVTSMYEDRSIKLNVQHKPMFKKLVHSKVNQAYSFIGGEVNLTCEAVAEPAANFTWFRPYRKLTTIPGRIIQKTHRTILQLYIHNASVFGDYLCKATNNLGTLDQIVTLLEGVKPPRPLDLRLRGLSSDTFSIEIQGPHLNQTQLPEDMLPIGYRIQYRPKGVPVKWTAASVIDFNDVNAGGFYIINGLMHNTEYEVRAASRNIAGISDYTLPCIYQTLSLQADSITSCSSLTTLYSILHLTISLLVSLL